MDDVTRRGRKGLAAAFALAGVTGALDASAAFAGDTSLSQPESVGAPSTTIGGAIKTYFDSWEERVQTARATQPEWSSPLVTTTAMLEERVRFDIAFQRTGNGADMTDIDGGKGLDLIVGESTEIQIAAAPYVIRTAPSGKGQLSGFNDWPFFRIKERLFSSPQDAGDYVVSAWVQTQAATGISALTNHAFTVLPTLGFGKGFGPFVIQGTFGAVIPTAYEYTLGTQLASNLAFQYHLWQVLWPQMEINWTHYLGGQRGGKDQVFLTPGVVVGRFLLTDRLKFTVGAGYQFAIEPHYQASPLLPAYNHEWLVTTRLTF
ncbi:MAG: hypothetical protein WAN51_13050 [Alphaproteobacteria bacterium]